LERTTAEAQWLAGTAEAERILQSTATHLLLARCLAMVAEAGIADLLAAGPRTATELAARSGLNADALGRVLRFLASQGFFAGDEDQHFRLTPLAEALRADVPGSLRERLRLPLQDLVWRTYQELPHALFTGEPAFDHAFGEPFFSYLAGHPDLNAIFDRAMARVSALENEGVAAAYPFAIGARVVDVGGGQGGLLAAVLERHPGVRGVLFDQPNVVAAPLELEVSNLTGRWECIGGDFFESVPPGADVYLLKRILHDWEDARAIRILANCRAAMTAHARLLIVEAIANPSRSPDPVAQLDVNIMALTAGRERSEPEFRRLCGSAGLAVTRIVRLSAPAVVAIIEVRTV
jgi:hypothetical protein